MLFKFYFNGKIKELLIVIDDLLKYTKSVIIAFTKPIHFVECLVQLWAGNILLNNIFYIIV